MRYHKEQIVNKDATRAANKIRKWGPPLILIASIAVLCLSDLEWISSSATDQEIVLRATQGMWAAIALMGASIGLMKFVGVGGRVVLVVALLISAFTIFSTDMTITFLGH